MATNGLSGQYGTRLGDKEKIPMTREGLEEKKKRLEFLITERRQQVADYIHEAKEAGDVSESSAYEDAKNLQAMVEGEIQELQRVVDNAYIIEEMPDDAEGQRTIRLGSKIMVETPRGLKEMTLVSTHEANTAASKISNDSPVGRALLGRAEGDKVEVMTPGGPQTYIVKSIK